MTWRGSPPYWKYVAPSRLIVWLLKNEAEFEHISNSICVPAGWWSSDSIWRQQGTRWTENPISERRPTQRFNKPAFYCWPAGTNKSGGIHTSSSFIVLDSLSCLSTLEIIHKYSLMSICPVSSILVSITIELLSKLDASDQVAGWHSSGLCWLNPKVIDQTWFHYFEAIDYQFKCLS